MNEKNLESKIDKIVNILERRAVIELIDLMGNTKRFFIRNFFSGIIKGLGIGIGLTIVTAILLILLQNIVKLNIPIISDYIVQIVEIVEKRL